jgi:segregation and condensation protein B
MNEEVTGNFKESEVSSESGLGAPSVRSAVEALLILQDDGVTTLELAQHIGRPDVEIQATLSELQQEYLTEQRGFEIREVNGRWRFYSSSICSELIERYVKDGQNARLTQASLETLSVIAYRQPTTRARVAAIRGVNVDGVIRTLMARGLVQESGTEQGSGALLIHTTDLFLERMGITSLDDLPSIEQFLPDIAAIEALTDAATDIE